VVCNTRRDLGSDVVDALSSLLDKSLVQQVGDGDEVRFSMLETLREYALERLVESGELAPARKAHAAYCLVVAEEGNALLTDLDREEWLASCDTEHDNMRAALDWLVEQNEADWGLRLAGALFTFWERREHLVEGRARCEALLKLPGASGGTRPRANIVRFAAAFASTMGDFESADRLNAEAFEIYRELGDRKGMVSQVNARGVHACLAGNWLVARRAFEESLAECRELGDLRWAALRQTLGAPRRPRDRRTVDETVDELRRRQDGASIRPYWTTGATMVLEDAIRYALDERISPPSAGPAGQTTEPKLYQA
jgi:hypothetical protein